MPLSVLPREFGNISTPGHASRTRLRAVAPTGQNGFACTTSSAHAPSAARSTFTRTRNVNASTREQPSITNSVQAPARSLRIAGQIFTWAKHIVGTHVVCDESVQYNFTGWSVKVEWGDNALRFHDTDRVGGPR